MILKGDGNKLSWRSRLTVDSYIGTLDCKSPVQRCGNVCRSEGWFVAPWLRDVVYDQNRTTSLDAPVVTFCWYDDDSNLSINIFCIKEHLICHTHFMSLCTQMPRKTIADYFFEIVPIRPEGWSIDVNAVTMSSDFFSLRTRGGWAVRRLSR